MNFDELVAYYPHLFHVTHPDAWPGIRRIGLLSTDRLLDLYEVAPARREELLRRRRPEYVRLAHTVHGTAMLRDQKPLVVSKLERLLDGISTADYLELLNSQVFFWTAEARLRTLLDSRAYRAGPQVVLRFDTRSLVARHASAVRLSRINSGATARLSGRRGAHTFQTVDAFRHPRPKPGTDPRAVAELTVVGGVPDAMEHLVEAERWEAGAPVETLYEREGEGL